MLFQIWYLLLIGFFNYLEIQILVFNNFESLKFKLGQKVDLGCGFYTFLCHIRIYNEVVSKKKKKGIYNEDGLSYI